MEKLRYLIISNRGSVATWSIEVARFQAWFSKGIIIDRRTGEYVFCHY